MWQCYTERSFATSLAITFASRRMTRLTMNFGLHELLMSCFALAALPVFFFAPGYVAASGTNLMGFRRLGWSERLLWATALSLPFALLFAVHPGISIPPRVTTLCFIACALASAGFLWRDAGRDGPRDAWGWDRYATVVAIAAVALVPYVLLSAFPLPWGGRLYESAVWQDWNVRIQLVNAAIRGGNALGNPMFAPGGQPAPLHYYYFWYVLCGRMHDVVPVSARAVFTASCAGSALSLLAFLLLAVKYFGSPRIAVRRQCAAVLLVACILGLDLVAITVTLLHGRFYSDVQFWLDDRSPGFLHMVLWSPHHVAGLVCCGLGTLLFVQALGVSRRQQLVHAGIASICFAASVGTSTFITLLFASACAVIFADALRRREWPVISTMAITAVLSVLLVAPFLHGVLLAPSGAPVPKAGKHLLSFTLRYKNQSLNFLWLTIKALDKTVTKHPAPTDANFNRLKWLMRIFRPPYIAGLLLFDLGFFLFILVYQFRRDLRARQPMSRQARILWLMFAGIAVPGFFLNSGGLQANNDFGRHAGFCLRLIFLLWAAPPVADFLARWRESRRAHTALKLTTMTRVAVALAAIGLLGQIAEIVLVRIRFPLTDAGLLPRVVVEERVPHIGYRFAQVQQAMSAATRITPREGIVQGNPHSRLRNVYLLYTNRQMAASDDGCNTPFGGDPRLCEPMARALIQLFGGMGPHYQGAPKVFDDRIGFDPAAVTPANFARVCSAYKLDAVVAGYVDPVWWDKTSWVWQLQPVFANSTARVFRCASPAVPPAPVVSETRGSPYTGF